ncbi:sigma-70 family RNA polymerase sigma factor [Frankia sp. AgB32]|uniref:RNA polymerase sigma factor n=1 Tax=Frankia sp. AgB32 TaxID=631119 RepID=UPI002010305A|nr:sigma-70 family RNA polymerase sigma factor [Frankia sp. AgB32]MCK9894018.1 sigma-70 family RNA polymerase sigma factor [Frankia sp. AgB32]
MRIDDDARGEFTALYEAQYAPVLRYALREVPGHAAGDVVAETFMTAWRRLSEVPDPPLPWLLGVARRVVANQRRGETRLRRLQLAVGEHAVFVEGSPAETLAERDAVRAALGLLSVADRELLTLIGWDGLSVREAAQVLGIRASTASVRLHRARRRLQDRLTSGAAAPTIPDHPLSTAEEAS